MDESDDLKGKGNEGGGGGCRPWRRRFKGGGGGQTRVVESGGGKGKENGGGVSRLALVPLAKASEAVCEFGGRGGAGANTITSDHHFHRHPLHYLQSTPTTTNRAQ